MLRVVNDILELMTIGDRMMVRGQKTGDRVTVRSDSLRVTKNVSFV